MHGYNKARTTYKNELCLSSLIIIYGQKPDLLWIAITKKGIKNVIYFEMLQFDCFAERLKNTSISNCFDFLLNLLLSCR